MPGFDYGRMQKTATRLMGRFSQGVVKLIRSTESPPANAWEAGSVTTTEYVLKATVRPVEQKYVDGTTIVGNEDQITFAVPEVEPSMTDQFSIDGVVKTLVALRRIPKAGTAVAFIAFVRS